MKFEGIDVQRAMVVYAHPDDAEFGLAGTVAKWAKAGVEITYCMVTNGASGSDDETMTREKLRDTRYAEQREAAKILGVKNCVFLGYEDGYLYPTLEVRRDVARQIRIHRPDVLIGMDPTMRIADDFYVNHPDHIAAGEVTLRSINPDASTRQMVPELWKDEHLEPHKPKLLMLQAFQRGATTIDISDVLEVKIKALRAHKSQLWPGAEELIRDFAKRAGKAAGYKAGEAFRVIHLERPDEAETPRRSRGRRGVQRRVRRSTRAAAARPATKRTPSRRKRSR
jgi:LmbE family N-acetylglucosaminyl deacetylase